MNIFKDQVAAGVVVRAEDTGAVLMVRNRRRRVWEYPGGLVRKTDRTPRYAAARELFEETGLDLRLRWIIGVDQLPLRFGRTLTYQTYAAIVPTMRQDVKLSIEHDTWGWMLPEDAVQRTDVWDRVRRRFVTYLDAEHWPARHYVGPQWRENAR